MYYGYYIASVCEVTLYNNNVLSYKYVVKVLHQIHYNISHEFTKLNLFTCLILLVTWLRTISSTPIQDMSYWNDRRPVTITKSRKYFNEKQKETTYHYSKMSVNSTKFKELYFKHKEIVILIGEPSLKTLHNILLQLNDNISSVSCTLRRGTHCYVRMILSPMMYTKLAPMTTFIIMTHPRIWARVDGATQYAITLAKVQRETYVRAFTDYQLIEKQLIQQIITVIETKYVNILRSCTTCKVLEDICMIVLYISMYTKISLPRNLAK